MTWRTRRGNNYTGLPNPLKRTIRERDGECCRRCGKLGSSSEPVEYHHIIPRSEGGTNDPDNILILCVACHRLWHSTRRRSETIHDWIRRYREQKHLPTLENESCSENTHA